MFHARIYHTTALLRGKKGKETDPVSGRDTEVLDERETRGTPDFLLSPLERFVRENKSKACFEMSSAN
jgi:hypothetical protein